jgi:cytochrome d ubiquinol oxidase subunit II
LFATSAIVSSIFIDLYPNVMVSSTSAAFNLTVSGTASSDYALKTMTVVAAIFLPVILGYQAWNYYVFRSRVFSGPSDSADKQSRVEPPSPSSPVTAP